MSSHVESEGHRKSQQISAEIEYVKSRLLEMGAVLEKQLGDGMLAITCFDGKLAREVLNRVGTIDAMEAEIDEKCNLILDRYQPAPSEWRLVLAIMTIIRELKRIGGESIKIARMAVKLSDEGEFSQGIVEFRQLGARVTKMLNMILAAFARYDALPILEVSKDDAIIDTEYGSAMRSMISYMMEDPRSVSRVLNLLWALRALERISVYTKNSADAVIYLVKGVESEREKAKS